MAPLLSGFAIERVERVARVIITPAVLLAAINARAADRKLAREPEPLPPPPTLCAIVARLARAGGEVTFVPRTRDDEEVAERTAEPRRSVA